MTPCLTDSDLEQMHAGASPTEQAERFRAHLAACDACRQCDAAFLADHNAFVAELRDAREQITVAVDGTQMHVTVQRPDSHAYPVSGRYWNDPASARPSVPDYDLLQPLGKGSFGEVWLARQRLTSVYYAIKFVPKSAVAAVELDGIRAYKQRAAGHPHLVQIEHVGQLDDCFYYVMELADDARGSGVRSPEGYEPRTLAEELHRRGALPIDEARTIATHVLDGLSHLHEAGLLHRDVKPANIIMKDSRWKLADVGLVTSSARPGMAACTPAYSPPEGVVDRTGDLYCVGVLLTEMVGGARQRDAAGLITWSLPDVATALRGLVEKACDTNPAHRYHTAREMRAALPRDADSPPRGWGLSLLLGRWRFTFQIAGVAAALLLITTVMWPGGPRPDHTDSNVQVPPPATAPATAPQIKVFFKRHRDTPERHLTPGDLPLTTGCLLRAEATLPRPGYPVLYLLFSNEPPTRRYPETNVSATPQTSLAYPPLSTDPSRQDYLQLEPPVGMAAFLLLSSDEPVPDLTALDASMQSIRITSADRPRTLWLGDPSNPEPLQLLDRGVARDLVKAARGDMRLTSIDALNSFDQRQLLAFAYVTANPSASKATP